MQIKKFDNVYKRQRHYFADKGPYNPSYAFFSSHVWMWELDHKEGWALKNWCYWTVVLEKTLESPLDCKWVNPKGDQSWILIESTDAEAPIILWATDWEELPLLEKKLMLGKIKGRRRKGWQRMKWFDGITNLLDVSCEQAPEDGEGWGSLAYCTAWAAKPWAVKSQTDWLNSKDTT